MERKYMPVILQAEDKRDFKFQAAKTVPVTVPRSVDFTSSCPSVYDQLTLGSCTANAWLSAFKMYLISVGIEPTEDFSRLFLYYMERELEGTADKDAGAQMRSGGKVLNKYGVCLERLMPYLVDKFAVPPSDAAKAEALHHMIPAYQSVTGNTAGIKQYLAEQQAANKPRAVVIGIRVFESFEGEQVRKTGIVPMPREGEALLGGHAVYIPAYDDDFGKTLQPVTFAGLAGEIAEFIRRQFNLNFAYVASDGYVKFGNSWGTDWGKGGFGYLPYAYIDKYAYDFWVISERDAA